MSAPSNVQRCRQWLLDQIEAMGTLRTANSRDAGFKNWRQNTVTAIQRIWPEDRERVERFRRIVFTPPHSRPDGKLTREWFGRGIGESRNYLTSLLEIIDREGVPEPSAASRDRDNHSIEDEVGFPMLELGEEGAEAAPPGGAEAGEPAQPAGGLGVTAGYTTPDDQGATPRDPRVPAPPSLVMRWRAPSPSTLMRRGGVPDHMPPALGESAADPARSTSNDDRPAVQIPRAPSLSPAPEPVEPTATAPAEAAAPSEPAAPAAPADPVAPVASQSSEPPRAAAPPTQAKPAATPVQPQAKQPAPPTPVKPAATPVQPQAKQAAPPAPAKPAATPAATPGATPAQPQAKQAAPPAPVKPAATPVQPQARQPDVPAQPQAPARPAAEAPAARREAPARGKAARGRAKKAAPKGKLRDMLGLDEFDARAEELLAEAPPDAVAAPPAGPTPGPEAPPAAAPAPPAAPSPRPGLVPVAAAPAPPPAAAPLPPPPAEEPAAAEEDDAGEVEAEDERVTLDFMLNSPVFGAIGRPVQRRTDTTEYLDPDAVAIATLAGELGRHGVPDAMKLSMGARLIEVARHLENGELDWALLRASITDAMQYPALARRLLPVLLPWLERAA